MATRRDHPKDTRSEFVEGPIKTPQCACHHGYAIRENHGNRPHEITCSNNTLPRFDRELRTKLESEWVHPFEAQTADWRGRHETPLAATEPSAPIVAVKAQVAHDVAHRELEGDTALLISILLPPEKAFVAEVHWSAQATARSDFQAGQNYQANESPHRRLN